MSFWDLQNFATARITVAPTPAASGATLTIAPIGGAIMPAVPFMARIKPSSNKPTRDNSEFVMVTAMTGNNVTAMTRAQEGSNARSIQVGDLFEQVVSAALLKQYEDEIEALKLMVPASGTGSPEGIVDGNRGKIYSEFDTGGNFVQDWRKQTDGGTGGWA